MLDYGLLASAIFDQNHLFHNGNKWTAYIALLIFRKDGFKIVGMLHKETED